MRRLEVSRTSATNNLQLLILERILVLCVQGPISWAPVHIVETSACLLDHCHNHVVGQDGASVFKASCIL